MATAPYAARLAAYSSASTHGGVAAADPHRLIQMLMDGALDRIATARGCIERGETVEKARLLNRTVSIIGELYDYMSRAVLTANAENSAKLLDEVSGLLHEIRGAWAAIPSQARSR